MLKKLVLPVLVIASGLVIWDATARQSSDVPPASLLTGSVADFTPSAPDGPVLEGEMIALDGKPVPLADYRGRVLLVNFWATWCAPCIREMPSLKRLHEARGGDDFAVIALSQDFQGWKKVTPFLARHDLAGLPVFVDEKMRIGRSLKIGGLPATVLLDRDGRVLGRLTGVAEWDSDEALSLIDYYRMKGG